MSDDITNMQYWTVRAHITGTDGQVVSNRYHRAILDSAEVDRWCDQPLATVGHDGQWIVHDAMDVLFDPQMPRPLSGQLWDVLHTIADQLRVTVPLIALGMDQDAHMQADTGPLTLRNDSTWSITRVDATGGEQRIVTASTHRDGKQYTIDTTLHTMDPTELAQAMLACFILETFVHTRKRGAEDRVVYDIPWRHDPGYELAWRLAHMPPLRMLPWEWRAANPL